jgi:predicted nucleotidyltransferase
MVRPLDARSREYVRRPLNVLLGAPSHIAVLRTLHRSGTGMTGRQIARLSEVAVQATHDALARLEEANLVRWVPAGRAKLYELNRNHYLFAKGILPLLEAESEFRSHIKAILRRALEGHVVSAAIFGSAARGDDRPTSDLDVLLIAESRKDREKAEDRAGAVFDRLKKEFGVTLSAVSFGLPDFVAGYRKGKSFFQTVVKEGETVAGKELTEVIRG